MVLRKATKCQKKQQQLNFQKKRSQWATKLPVLTLKEAKELSDYLKEEHGIEAAAGGAVVMAGAGPGADAGAAEVQTEFDVVLTGFGDKKLDVVKVVKAITGASLMDAKKMVESCPATLKEGASKEEADKIKADVDAAGGSIELK